MGGDGIIYLPDSSVLEHVYSYMYKRAVRKESSCFEYLENRSVASI